MEEFSLERLEFSQEDERFFLRLSSFLAEEKLAGLLARGREPLKEREALMVDLQREIEAKAHATYERALKGFQALSEGLLPLLEEMGPGESLRVREEYEGWVSFLLSTKTTAELLEALLECGGNLQEAFFLSNETMSAFYQVGRRYLQAGAFEKARALFSLLTHLNGEVFEFWLALGAASQALGEMEGALAAYHEGGRVKTGDPLVELLRAECLLSFNERERAEAELQIAEEKMVRANVDAGLTSKFHKLARKLKLLPKVNP